jgi:hypothetical protein
MLDELRYRRNLLRYPAGMRAGIDPTDPATRSLRLSGIAQGANIVNLLTGKPGAVQFIPAFALDGVVGPAFNAFNVNDQTNFTGLTTNDTSITIAAIIRFNSVASNQVVASTSSNNAGWRLLVSGGTLQLTAGAVADLPSSTTLVANVPYLIIASGNASVANFLALQLDTGKITTSTRSGATPVAPNSIYTIGGWNAFGQCSNGKLAAVMISANFMSLQEMRQWARDPWAFWYPRRQRDLAAPGVTLVNKTLPAAAGTYALSPSVTPVATKVNRRLIAEPCLGS